jgi:AraC-like DNA-binding protein
MAFRSYLEREGTLGERLFRQEGLPALCEDSRAFVPLLRAWSFFDVAQRHEDPMLGWLVGRFVGDNCLNATLLQKLETAPTLNLALRRLKGLVRSEASHLQLDVLERSHDVLFVTKYPDIEAAPGYHVSQAYQLSVYVDLIRHFLGRDWSPAEMGVEAPTVPFGLRDLFPGCRFLTRQRMGYIAIPRSCLYMSAKRLDARGGDALTMTDRFGFVDTLVALIKAYVAEGYLSARVAASLMDTSERTLARELSSRDLTYGTLVDEVRFNMSAEMLRETDERIADIGRTVGFDDPAHFARMFRRIAGISPRKYRHAVQHSANDVASTSRRGR